MTALSVGLIDPAFAPRLVHLKWSYADFRRSFEHGRQTMKRITYEACLHFSAFSQLQRVLHVDAQIAHRAVDFGMAE